MSFTFCTEAYAVKRAGTSVNATIAADSATLALWSTAVEGMIEEETRRDWTTNYGTLPSAVTGALQNASSAWIAIQLIIYDPDAYSNQRTAEFLTDVLTDNYNKSVKILRDFKSGTIKVAT